jgi:hypothetical protein
VVSCCVRGNELSCSINARDLLGEELLAFQEGLCSIELVSLKVNDIS